MQRLADIMPARGISENLRSDNVTEFVARYLRRWLASPGTGTLYIQPGSPRGNGYHESFNGTLRTECLDTHWFGTLEEAKQTIEAWRWDYNESCPHRALGERTPNEFAHEIAAGGDLMGLKTAENSP